MLSFVKQVLAECFWPAPTKAQALVCPPVPMHGASVPTAIPSEAMGPVSRTQLWPLSHEASEAFSDTHSECSLSDCSSGTGSDEGMLGAHHASKASTLCPASELASGMQRFASASSCVADAEFANCAAMHGKVCAQDPWQAILAPEGTAAPVLPLSTRASEGGWEDTCASSISTSFSASESPFGLQRRTSMSSSMMADTDLTSCVAMHTTCGALQLDPWKALVASEWQASPVLPLSTRASEGGWEDSSAHILPSASSASEPTHGLQRFLSMGNSMADSEFACWADMHTASAAATSWGPWQALVASKGQTAPALPLSTRASEGGWDDDCARSPSASSGRDSSVLDKLKVVVQRLQQRWQ